MGGVGAINRRKEAAGGWGQVASGGWEPGCQPSAWGISSPTSDKRVFFFLAQSFPDKKRPEAPHPHPSERSCLRLARGPSGDAIAAGPGSTPVLASLHRLLTPSPPAVRMSENQGIRYTAELPRGS